ncbi:SusD/RagB family nutrient-binding outer membrane lipoprotein [Flavitalea sp. BT771]|uniref:SusD/RagB family nutrient-binding outer membrane lipoprotein n=1 Tax=Flavitalea sp. BT771 TaxID=3063329 RepID=UPI0026E177A3|nr:SusD/RagB family nutrient-binding outer membrane lipoprotein [Flavitalea sp. BT771]MDO6434758.1 SusD/RagB family nutrient-binding outer membrane lipoprotein [Flavitalea sp. BT771]MDV6223658.1 SusD/RagB family nutrient-binding outer membrane lipoprotein [Flavitalea sp. BT771]
MKVEHNYKQSVICVLILVLLGAASCKKSFYSDVNVNPNAPSSASIVPGVLLPPIESAIGYLQGGDLSRFSSLNIQQVKGIGNQADGYYKYIYTSQDFDNVWANIYTAVLENDNILLQMSEAKGYHAYAGVARILRAYVLQVTVDTWGSVPYSKALQGAGNLKPAFDSDKQLYDTIGRLLEDGIAHLNNADPGALVPGDEDALYGGNSGKWIKFAHAIKARLFIHQSKGDAAMAANALEEIAHSFTGNGDNARYVFGSTETTANPWYQFNQQRSGQIGFSSGNVAKMMKDLHDPRLPILIDTSKKDALLYYGVTDAPVELITYDELQFATAESVLRNGGSIAAAQAFYQAAITANMSKLGVKDADITAYLAANGTLPGNVDAAIAQIATQGYLALYLNPEAWTLWRRTNSPALTPVTGTSVPRRLLYPQTEYSYNKANVPASVTLFSPKVFWDK